jgi:hypothetical protein
MNVNGVELNFMLDSGISETLLFSLKTKRLILKTLRRSLSGLGETVSVEALKSIKTNKIGEHFVDRSHTVFIVLDEDFNISQDIGIPVNGIIGYYFFKNHPIEINYQKTITVYKDNSKFPKRINKYSDFQ